MRFIKYTNKLPEGHIVDCNVATVMKKHDVCSAEAMMAITRARLKQKKPTTLPSLRIIDMLNNDIYQGQLEMWQACEYDIYENVIVNPTAPHKEWRVEKVGGSSEKKRDDVHDVQRTLKKAYETLPHISAQPHRLSTIEEVEEEARRLSTLIEE